MKFHSAKTQKRMDDFKGRWRFKYYACLSTFVTVLMVYGYGSLAFYHWEDGIFSEGYEEGRQITEQGIHRLEVVKAQMQEWDNEAQAEKENPAPAHKKTPIKKATGGYDTVAFNRFISRNQ